MLGVLSWYRVWGRSGAYHGRFRKRMWFHDNLTCLGVFILIEHHCLALEDSFLAASNRRGVCGIHRDVADEALLLELQPLPQNKRSVVWYHHWLVCLIRVHLASLEAYSKRRGESSSSGGSLTFLREPLGASSGIFWAVLWAMKLYLLTNVLRRHAFWVRRYGWTL